MKKYRTVQNVIVEAAQIESFKIDVREGIQSLVLMDGTEVLRPRVHGFNPHTGDWFVQGPPVISTRRVHYEEPGETMIVPKALFSQYYEEVPEPAPSVAAAPTVPPVEDKASE